MHVLRMTHGDKCCHRVWLPASPVISLQNQECVLWSLGEWVT